MLKMGKMRHRGRMTHTRSQSKLERGLGPHPRQTDSQPALFTHYHLLLFSRHWVLAGNTRTLPCHASLGAAEPFLLRHSVWEVGEDAVVGERSKSRNRRLLFSSHKCVF